MTVGDANFSSDGIEIECFVGSSYLVVVFSSSILKGLKCINEGVSVCVCFNFSFFQKQIADSASLSTI